MANVRRLRTQTGNPDWHGWLPLQPYRRTVFHQAVVIFLAVVTLIALKGALVAIQTGITRAHDHAGIGVEADGPHGSGLVGRTMTRHIDISASERTGHADADVVRLMLPHHQAAVDMARVLRLYGNDPQMCRLAQEILADQQPEIQLMQRCGRTSR
jgi:hypothetical protein